MMTKSEKQVMDLLWQSERPLSCTEIINLSGEKTWKDSYVHSLIKSLIKKGLVKIETFELVSRSYARKFAPKISYDEYVLTAHFTQEELHDPDRMNAFVQTILNYSGSDELKRRICNV